MHFVVIVLTSILLIDGVGGVTHIFVSNLGLHNSTNCGTTINPCHSLDFAISTLHKNHSRILIEAGPRNGSYKYEVFKTHLVRGSLIIEGLNGMPVIYSSGAQNVPFLFENADGTNLLVKKLKILNMGLIKSSGPVAIHISHCFFNNSKPAVVASSMSASPSPTVDGSAVLHISDSVFRYCSHVVDMGDLGSNCSITMLRSSIFGSNSLQANHRGLLIAPRSSFFKLHIQIEHSNFSSLAAGLYVHTSIFSNLVDISIHGCLFDSHYMFENFKTADIRGRKFGSAVSIVLGQGSSSVNITGSGFTKNKAFSAGALYFENVWPVNITNSWFTGNVASNYGGACLFQSTIATINSCHFYNNSANWRQYSNNGEQKGYGGAVANMGEAGQLLVENSFFDGNSATVFGGSIYHESDIVVLRNTQFYGPYQEQEHTLHGEIIYSISLARIKGCNFTARSSVQQRSLLFHSSPRTKGSLVLLPPFRLTCPAGHNVIPAFDYTEPSEVSLCLFYCQTCMKGQYSLDAGYIFLQTQKLDMWEPHIRWRTDIQPSPFYIYPITCKTCPPGGLCHGEIGSLNNFWGYDNHGDVAFVSCPWGYCCVNQSCPRYDACAPHRKGRLCSHCEDGFSEVWFSPKCVPNEECGNKWFFPVVIAIFFIYIFFLMYVKEIMSKFKAFLKLPSCWIQRVKSYSLTRRLLEESTSTTHSREFEQPADDISEDEYWLVTSADYRDEQFAFVNGVNYNGGKVVGVLKILVFFYQMQLLCKVHSKLEAKFEFPQLLKEFTTGVFNLKADGPFFHLRDFCPIVGMEPVLKELITTGFVFILFVLVFLLYLIWKVQNFIRTCNFRASSSTMHSNQRVIPDKPPFNLRLKCCFLQLLLFGYSAITVCLLRCVHCIRLKDGITKKEESYIYGAANYQCYQYWQYAVFVLLFTWSVPFCVALYFASNFLRQRYMTLNEFFLCAVFPPHILFIVARKWARGSSAKIMMTEQQLYHVRHVLLVLEEPFLKGNALKESLYWECVLIFRRLILICISIFMVNLIAMLYIMIVPLVCFLIHHLHKRPFNHKFLNWLETCSLTFLILLCTINLFWAYNYETWIPKSDMINLISEVFLFIETFILLLPLIILGLFLICVVISRVYMHISKKEE